MSFDDQLITNNGSIGNQIQIYLSLIAQLRPRFNRVESGEYELILVAYDSFVHLRGLNRWLLNAGRRWLISIMFFFHGCINVRAVLFLLNLPTDIYIFRISIISIESYSLSTWPFIYTQSILSP